MNCDLCLKVPAAKGNANGLCCNCQEGVNRLHMLARTERENTETKAKAAAK